jgi:hypothetical protein
MNKGILPSLVVASLILGANAQGAAVVLPHEERVTRSASGHVSDHATDELRDARSFETVRREPREVMVKSRATPSAKDSSNLKASYGDSWIYDASTDLFSDHDGDGYFHYLRVQFDADTAFAESWVYAEIYLSADGIAWEHLYSTDDFAIWGYDPDDDYEVETDLVSGYSMAMYDVLIELYDSHTGELLDEFGPNESPEFSLLPMEDSGRDGHVIDVPPPIAPAPVPDAVVVSGGGAMSWLMLPGLLGLLLGRRRRSA